MSHKLIALVAVLALTIGVCHARPGINPPDCRAHPELCQ